MRLQATMPEACALPRRAAGSGGFEESTYSRPRGWFTEAANFLLRRRKDAVLLAPGIGGYFAEGPQFEQSLRHRARRDQPVSRPRPPCEPADVRDRRENVTPREAIEAEPRWPAVLAALVIGGLNMALPESLSAGPRWLLLALVAVLLIPTALSRRAGRYGLNKALGHATAGTLTVFLAASVALLVKGLPAHAEPPATLLRSAALLWLSNILVFACWYWRLDAGGPHERDLLGPRHPSAFLFPQMTRPAEEYPGWSPEFLDYLFLAFNTSTAFSPTDTAVLTRWAKTIMMVQSAISLTVIAILAARAVNIL